MTAMKQQSQAVCPLCWQKVDIEDKAKTYVAHRTAGNSSRAPAECAMSGQVIQPLFALGQIVGTPGVLEALAQAGQRPDEFLARHHVGDWGQVPPEDAQENIRSVRQGFRLLSAYTLNTGVKIWIITEHDRSVTTLLLPEEY